jgi:hypothetical protein
MSAIFYQDPEQQQFGAQSLEEQSMGGMFRFPTQHLPLERFYLAEPYHQKHYLRRHGKLLKELASLFPDEESLIDSTAAARLNGALAGFGKIPELTSELMRLGILEKSVQQLVAMTDEIRRLGGV